MHTPEPPRAAEPTEPSCGGWRARLERLAGTTRAVANEDSLPTTPLALQFELRELVPRTAERWNGPVSRAVKPGQSVDAAAVRLGVRPVLRTARGWARGTLTWSNIAHQGGRFSLDPAQQLWFRQLHAVARAATTIVLGQDAQWVMLDDFVSPALWSMLDDAQDLGIALVVSGTHAPVRRMTDAQLAWEAGLDADGTMRLRPELRLDGDPLTFAECGAIGDHGVYIAERAGSREIRIAAAGRRWTAAELALLARTETPEPIAVPAADRAAFVTEGLPALRMGFVVSSSDAQVALPDSPAAGQRALELTAAWRRGHRLTLTWAGADTGTGMAPDFGRFLAGADLADECLPASWFDSGAQLPDPIELRDADAAEFLDVVLPRLTRVPGIQVRQSGRPPQYRAAVSAPSLTVATVPSEQDDWFDLGVLVTVDGKTVPFAPLFRALATGRKKLLLVDGTYLRLNHPALTPLAELIAEGQDLDEWESGARITRHQAIRLAGWEETGDEADGDDPDCADGSGSPERRAWQALVRDASRAAPEPVEVPTGVHAELRPYQRAGFSWLAFSWRHRLGGILADDMGLGKTLQCLTLIVWARERAPQPERRPFLVAAPTSVLGTWAGEAAKFVPGLRVVVRDRTEAASPRSIVQDVADADLIITSYALFRIDAEKYQAVARDPETGLAGLILDEAQAVKNASSRGHEAALTLPVAWKLAVTGTPMENSLRELHAICRIVAPGLLPAARRFDTEFVRVLERRTPGVAEGRGAGHAPEVSQAQRVQTLERLRTRLRPFLLRRTKELVAAELPAKQEQILEVELTPAHRQLYDAFLQRERQKLYGLITDLDRHRFTVFRSLTLLRMLALDASLIDAQHDGLVSAKLEALAEQTTVLAQEGRRALVFSQFTSFLDRARERLHEAGVRTVTLDGSTRDREGVIARFRAGEADVFLISLKAGGVGLTLVEADTVLLLDPWWNPASEAQAVDRTHRIGQRQPVQVIRIIATGTIEEKVLALQQRKQALFDSVIDEADHFSRAVTAADIRALLE